MRNAISTVLSFVVSIMALIGLLMCTNGCSSSFVKAQQEGVMTAIAATNGGGFTLLQLRQSERLACVDKSDTRPKAEACIATVDEKYKAPLESFYYFRETMTAWQNALLLYQDGKLSEAELIPFSAEVLKAYTNLVKALTPLGIKLPAWNGV